MRDKKHCFEDGHIGLGWRGVLAEQEKLWKPIRARYDKKKNSNTCVENIFSQSSRAVRGLKSIGNSKRKFAWHMTCTWLCRWIPNSDGNGLGLPKVWFCATKNLSFFDLTACTWIPSVGHHEGGPKIWSPDWKLSAKCTWPQARIVTIKTSPNFYNLGDDEIIHLQDKGRDHNRQLYSTGNIPTAPKKCKNTITFFGPGPEAGRCLRKKTKTKLVLSSLWIAHGNKKSRKIKCIYD